MCVNHHPNILAIKFLKSHPLDAIVRASEPSPDWDGRDRWVRWEWTGPSRLSRVEIDQRHKVPLDGSFADNSWTADFDPLPLYLFNVCKPEFGYGYRIGFEGTANELAPDSNSCKINS